MSRLPRLRSSSPDHHNLTSEPVPTLASTAYVNTRKRKSNIIDEEEDDENDSLNITNPAHPTKDDSNYSEAQDKLTELGAERPRKVAAIGGAGSSRPTRARTISTSAAAGAKGKGPLGPSKTAPNLNSSGSSDTGAKGGTKVPTLSSSNFGKGLPKSALSTSRPPPTLTRSGTRGTSAPPTSSSSGGRSGPVRVPVTRKPPSASSSGATAATRGVGRTLRSTTASSSSSRPTKPTNQLSTIQEQLASLEAARQADSLRLAQEMASERSKLTELQSHQVALSKQLTEAKSLELNHRRELITYADELDEMRKKHKTEVMELEIELRRKEREAREASEDLRVTRGDLERERSTTEHLRSTLHTQAQTQLTLSAENAALKAQLSNLQREVEKKDEEVREMRVEVEEKEKRVVQMKKEVFESETIRRKLHNMVLELKGNIRVFCRVRPVLPSDLPSTASIEELRGDDEGLETIKEELKANMAFPDKRDHKEIVLYSSSESAMGNERKEVYSFGFDRVFEPTSTQSEVFEEISQLAQSCIDGYNVCIFAYGQTGSGKSFTMEGGNSDSTAGMIPRAVEQVFRVAEEMKSKGWEYKIEGQFLEIYNESIHDLLSTSTSSEPLKKHEIKHDPKTGRTTVTDLTVVPLTSPSQVKVLLARAQKRRSVAATLMNERSSRSHSVFTLRICGVMVGTGSSSSSGVNGFSPSNGELETNEVIAGTGETCEGCLNLVDLAGSERLNVSFGPGVTEKERVKETQSINKSLSALGDVIAALGERGSGGVGSGHIPYRNSKLTYLLQNSLSGSSKTLMVLNLSPLAAHMNESLTSLRFATKVNNTQIGVAKKVSKTNS